MSLVDERLRLGGRPVDGYSLMWVGPRSADTPEKLDNFDFSGEWSSTKLLMVSQGLHFHLDLTSDEGVQVLGPKGPLVVTAYIMNKYGLTPEHAVDWLGRSAPGFRLTRADLGLLRCMSPQREQTHPQAALVAHGAPDGW